MTSGNGPKNLARLGQMTYGLGPQMSPPSWANRPMRSGTPDEILAKGRYVAASEQPLSFREKSVVGAFPRFVPTIVMLLWIAVSAASWPCGARPW